MNQSLAFARTIPRSGEPDTSDSRGRPGSLPADLSRDEWMAVATRTTVLLVATSAPHRELGRTGGRGQFTDCPFRWRLGGPPLCDIAVYHCSVMFGVELDDPRPILWRCPACRRPVHEPGQTYCRCGWLFITGDAPGALRRLPRRAPANIVVGSYNLGPANWPNSWP